MTIKTLQEILAEQEEGDMPHTENMWLEMMELQPEIMYEGVRPDLENEILDHATVIKDNRVVYVEYITGVEGDLIRCDYPDLTVEEVIAIVKDWEQQKPQLTE
jgi:hypothetical protein